MTSEEIQKATKREELQKRLTEKDVRKVERRLLKRKIVRLKKEAK